MLMRREKKGKCGLIYNSIKVVQDTANQIQV